MGSYIINFTVYTLAMSGLIFLAVFIYKKVISGSFYSKSGSHLEIEETMSINPRKTLMIIRAGNERFLVASDFDRTSLISKLEPNKHESIKDTLQNLEPSVTENISTHGKDNYVELSPETNEPIRLELIKGVNKNNPRRKKRAVSKEKVDSKTKSRIDTMKQMAKKINGI